MNFAFMWENNWYGILNAVLKDSAAFSDQTPNILPAVLCNSVFVNLILKKSSL